MEEVNNEEYQIVKDKIGLDNVVADLISDEVIKEFDKRLKKKIVNHLESFKYHYIEMSKDSINNMWKRDAEALDLAIQIIKNQEAEKEKFGKDNNVGKWIPVSERLPEEMGNYMVTMNYGKYGNIIGQRYYYGLGEWSDDCVIAWMPLPEPYKLENEVE